MDKKMQRNKAKIARESLSERDRECCSMTVSQRLADLPVVASARVIMSYIAFGAELNLDLFHKEMQRAEKILAFPVTSDHGHMEAYVPQGADAWTIGVFGIRTPIPEKSRKVEPVNLDLIIVPCLAFDNKRMRVGWGGGYYDRYLPRCTNAYKVGVAYEAQRVEEIVGDPLWDIATDIFITESHFYE